MSYNWYPTLTRADRQIQDAVRRILDFIYELRDQLSPTAIYAMSSVSLTDFTISTVRSPIPDCQLRLHRPGIWLVTGCVTITVDGDAGKLFTVSLRQGTTISQPTARLLAADTTVCTVTQQWLVETQKPSYVFLEIVKESTAIGDSLATQNNSTLSAAWQGVNR